MARDLSFWKYKKNELIDDVEVYTQLSKGWIKWKDSIGEE